MLLLGGAGYIGSHVAIDMIDRGFNPIIFDDLSNSYRSQVDKISEVCNREVVFIEADISNVDALRKAIQVYEIRSCVHLAGYKSVEESVRSPLTYYDNNVAKSIILFRTLLEEKIEHIIFSSSAAVYGNSSQSPIREDAEVKPINPYGHTKAMQEQILHDLYTSSEALGVGVLRYFNPVGSHSSYKLRAHSKTRSTNIASKIVDTMMGKQAFVEVFGNDYDTPDKTAIRDYVHVVDLASAHVLALLHLMKKKKEWLTLNIGTGEGYSVLDLINAFNQYSSDSIEYKYFDRRLGDAGVCYADADKSREVIGWNAKKGISEMCGDAYFSELESCKNRAS